MMEVHPSRPRHRALVAFARALPHPLTPKYRDALMEALDAYDNAERDYQAEVMAFSNLNQPLPSPSDTLL